MKFRVVGAHRVVVCLVFAAHRRLAVRVRQLQAPSSPSGAPRARPGIAARRVGQLWPARYVGRARMGEAQHRRVRRRSGQRDDLRRIGRWHGSVPAAGRTAGRGAVPKSDIGERRVDVRADQPSHRVLVHTANQHLRGVTMCAPRRWRRHKRKSGQGARSSSAPLRIVKDHTCPHLKPRS